MPAQSQSVDDGLKAENAGSSASGAAAAKPSIGSWFSRASMKRDEMAVDNEQIVRKAYQTAEDYDIPGWVAAFTEDGTFTDESAGVAYRGPDRLGIPVEIYKKAFPDMHRKLFRFYVSGDDVVVVQLALQGTHLGPLSLPEGIIPPTGRRMDAPCCDVFELSGGKIKRFDCYPEVSIILKQLGVLGDLQAVLQRA
ncbi:MAG: nuclear transport factor 2 family protein [Pseudonocardiaceae bacterium]